jgi:hypothetical protein
LSIGAVSPPVAKLDERERERAELDRRGGRKKQGVSINRGSRVNEIALKAAQPLMTLGKTVLGWNGATTGG